MTLALNISVPGYVSENRPNRPNGPIPGFFPDFWAIVVGRF